MPKIQLRLHKNILYCGPANFDIWVYIKKEIEPDTLWIAYTDASYHGLMILAQASGGFKYYELTTNYDDFYTNHLSDISTPAQIKQTFSNIDPFACLQSDSKYKQLENSIASLGLLYPTKQSITYLLDHPYREIRLFTITKILPSIKGQACMLPRSPVLVV